MPLHPADELAQIRAELKRLHQREDELLRFFREDAGAQHFSGDTHDVTVISHKKRVFEPRKLPQAILANPKFYRDELRTLVSSFEKPLALPYQALLQGVCDVQKDQMGESGIVALPI